MTAATKVARVPESNEHVEHTGDDLRDFLVSLSPLQAKLIRHFFRLQELERRRFKRARGRRGITGGSAIRQLELERQRLGRELHTGVGQMLAAIGWQLEIISTAMPSPSEDVRQALQSISTLTAQTMEQVRGLSQGLHPPDWSRVTLESVIRQLWQISGTPQRFTATLSIDPLPLEPDLEVKTLIYRAFQEALSNVARHGHATRIDAALCLRDTGLLLTIMDNGVGFDGKELLAPANVGTGIGLRSIREMAHSLGGKFEVESGPAGTKLAITVALSAADHARRRVKGEHAGNRTNNSRSGR